MRAQPTRRTNALSRCAFIIALGLTVTSCDAGDKGDLDGNGQIDGNDIPGLLDAVLNPGGATPGQLDSADIGGPGDPCGPDAVVDENDITGLVFLLLDGSCNFVPVILQGDGPLPMFVLPGQTCPAPSNEIVLSAKDYNADDALLQWSIVSQPLFGAVSIVGAQSGPVVTVCYQPASDPVVADNFVVQVDDGEGGIDQITLNVSGPEVLYRVNAGGSDYTDVDGNLWVADTGFYNLGSTMSISQTVQIAGTNLDELYRSERWDSPQTPEMTYSFPVAPGGTYRVRLHFAEIFWSLPGRRIFDVAIEGQTLLSNYDIVASVGALTADVHEFVTQVVDGSLDIQFIHGVENPKISAIEIESAGGLIPPTITNGDTIAMTVPLNGDCLDPADQIVLTAVDLDADDALLTWAIQTQPLSGSAAFVGGQNGANAVVCYAPDPLQLAPDSFVVVVTDADGGADAITVSVTVVGTLPTVAITSPSEGANVPPGDVAVAWIASGDLTEADHVLVALDGGPAAPVAQLSGSHTFTAVAPGPHSIEVRLVRADGSSLPNPESVATVSFQVQAQTADLQAIPPSVDFGSVTTGSSSAVASVTLQNTGQTDITITALTLSGANPNDFAMTPPALPLTVPVASSTSLDLLFVPAQVGSLTATLLVTTSELPADVTVALAGIGVAPPPGEIVLYRVNAGGPDYTDPDGNLWTTDTGFYNTGAVFSTTAPIAGTTADPVYQTERFDPASGAEMSYSFPLDPGTYRVRLHFAEIWGGAFSIGARVFDVLAESQLVLDDLDVFAQVGADAAFVAEFDAVVTDAALDIEFLHVVENPKIAGIEIVDLNLGDLQAAPALIEWGNVLIGQPSDSRDILLTNAGTEPVTISTLSFLINTGDSHDFHVTLAGVDHSGGHMDLTIPVNVPVAVGQTLTVPVLFLPTELEDNDIWLEFGGNFPAQRVRLRGVGAGSVSHPFLHVVIVAPPVVVDYDQDGVENVFLKGSDSHTHQLGHVLTAFEWSETGTIFSTVADVTAGFAAGSHTVSLTIYDDNVPPETLTDSATFVVAAPDAVPGTLVLYYEGNGDPTALLDAVPTNADFGEVTAPLRVDNVTGLIGTSPYADDVMLRLLATVDLPATDTYTFQAAGGADRRLFVDGTAVSGPVLLAAGPHAVEARFAVAVAAEVPVEVTYAQGAGPQTPIPDAQITHDETAMLPVINSAPTEGIETGGNQIDIKGLGFFPTDQVVVHWGGLPISGPDLVVTPSCISLISPPGVGLVDVTVETPNGLSNSFQFNYTVAGPAPIVFTLSDVAVVTQPTTGTWGPDGRLYVGSTSGQITVLTFDDAYNVTATQTINTLTSVPNMQILGITTNPFDPPDPVRLYVAHSQLFANGGSCFTGFSPYSGQVSILTGPAFDVVEPLITGLPVSNHDHGVNGLEFDNNGDLLICVGGNTNAGIPACNSGGLPESPLTGAVLKAELSKPGFNGQITYVETATGTPNDDQVFGDIVDVAPGVDVTVFGAGLRNSFDVVFTTWDMVYATDNGPNPGFGPASMSADTQSATDPAAPDELDLIEPGNYYGHPNRNRGRTDDRQNVYHGIVEPSVPGVFTQALTDFVSSTNGIVEYRANTFQGAMRGDLLAQKWNGETYRVILAADGRSVVSKQTLPVGLASLDITTGPGGVLFGMDFSSNKVVIARPDPTPGFAVYDIFPWRAPATGGTGFVIGGEGFGTLADTTVTIDGIPAALTSVGPTRIRGTVPANPGAPVALVNVVVTVGADSRLLPSAFRYLQPPGGGATGDIWQAGSSMPVAMGEVAAGVINGKMYLTGESSPATLAYDFLSGTWTSPTALAVRPTAGNHQVTEVINGKLYLFGGLSAGSGGKVQVYDPVTDSWSFGADMPFATGSASSALINGEIYVCGGIVNGATVTDLARYNPATDTWTAGLAPMPQGRNHAASATDGAKFYVFGGRGPGSGDGNVVANGFDTVQIYDPATDTWQSSLDPGSTLAPLPQARGGMGKAVYFNGEFYVIGGETQDGAGAVAGNVYNRVDIYDPVTNTWRLGAPMPTARHGIFPVLYNGQIHVAGGGTNAGFSSSAVYESYTP